ncbi:hypothetical protein H7J86_32515 [Mycobacterium hackensackense]|nr:hypothetical protein [Mycobacterium hackensackense]
MIPTVGQPSGSRQLAPRQMAAAAVTDRVQKACQLVWTKTFADPRLYAAIVDRLTFGGTIIETGTASYRLAHARTKNTAAG